MEVDHGRIAGLRVTRVMLGLVSLSLGALACARDPLGEPIVEREGLLTLDDFTVYASEALDIRDRGATSGGAVGSAATAEIGADSSILGSVRAMGTVLLRDRAIVDGDVVSGSTITRQNGVVITGTLSPNTPVPGLTIPTKTVTPGATDISVGNGQSSTPNPGSYRDVTAFAGATITLRTGRYQLRKLNIQAGAVRLILNVQAGPIDIDVTEDLQIGDRTIVEVIGGASANLVRFYSHQTTQARLGTDVAGFQGVVTVPRGEFLIFSRTDVRGAIFGKRVTIGPDCRVLPREAVPQPPRALLVAGQLPLSDADESLRQAMIGEGFATIAKTASAVSGSEVTDLVVISESTLNTDVAAKFKNTVAPVVVMEPLVFPSMGMVTGTSNVGESASETKVNIVTPQHPLAGGLTGSLQVTFDPQKFVWGVPGGQAVNVATLSTNPNRSTLFGFERDALLADGTRAAGRRVGFFAGALTPRRFTDAGWTLFRAAIRWAAAPRALLVVGALPLSAGDLALQSRLETLGFAVLARAGRDVATLDARGRAVVVISESTVPADLGSRLTAVTTPVISLAPRLFGTLGFTGSTLGTDFGELTGATQIQLRAAGHPLGGGLPDGPTSISTAATKIGWAKPRGQFVNAATVLNDATRSTIFGYERGATMNGTLGAPGRRVGFFAGRDTPTIFTTPAWTLFDAAVRWATGLFESVAPKAECVIEKQPGQFMGVFGYQSSSPVLPLTIPVGVNNKFTSGASNRGQPTTFLPGHHPAQFTVEMTSSALSWSVNGQSAILTTSSPRCSAACVDPLSVVANVYNENALLSAWDNPTAQQIQQRIDSFPGAEVVLSPDGRLLKPALTTSESRTIRDSFSWRQTTPIPETDEDGRPALYHAYIYVETRDEINALHGMQIHFDPLPLFDEEERVVNGQLGTFQFPYDDAGGFAHAIIPGAIFNIIREAAVDPVQAVEVFRAVHLQPVPNKRARACSSAGLAAFAGASAAPSCPVRPSFEQQACAARIDYDYLGENGFKYRGLDVGEVDLAAQAVYDQFPPSDGINDPDVQVIRQQFLGRLVRKVLKKVVRTATAVVDGVRTGLTQVARLFVGSNIFHVQVVPRNTDTSFGGPLTPLLRAWGPRAPMGSESTPGAGSGAPISIPGLEIRASKNVFLSSGRTNNQNIADVRVLTPGRTKICVRFNSDPARLESWFWVMDQCHFRIFTPPASGTMGPGTVTAGEDRFFINGGDNPANVQTFHIAHSLLNVIAQVSDARSWTRDVMGFTPRKALVLAGAPANRLNANVNPSGPAYAPCLGIPNWTNPIPTIAAALGAYYVSDLSKARWVRQQLKSFSEKMDDLTRDIFGNWTVSLREAQTAAANLRNQGFSELADELVEITAATDQLFRSAEALTREADRVADDLYELENLHGRASDDDKGELRNQINTALSLFEQLYRGAGDAWQEADTALNAYIGAIESQFLIGLGIAGEGFLAGLRSILILPAIGMAADIVGIAVQVTAQVLGGALGFVAGEIVEIFLDADLVMPDGSAASRVITTHEYGHLVFCNLLHRANSFKYGLAYTEAMINTVLGQVDGRDRSENEDVFINEAFADFVSAQVMGGVDYFIPATSLPAGDENVCPATTGASQCVDQNSAGVLPGAANFTQQVARTMTTIQDVFDGHCPGGFLPSDGRYWTGGAR